MTEVPVSLIDSNGEEKDVTINYRFANLTGTGGLFNINYCHTDRVWRRQLLLTNEKFLNTPLHQFDECNNVFVKPKAPLQYNF